MEHQKLWIRWRCISGRRIDRCTPRYSFARQGGRCTWEGSDVGGGGPRRRSADSASDLLEQCLRWRQRAREVQATVHAKGPQQECHHGQEGRSSFTLLLYMFYRLHARLTICRYHARRLGR
jgi:hypothetical protein